MPYALCLVPCALCLVSCACACAWCCIGLVLEDRSLQPPAHAGNAGFGGGGSQINAAATATDAARSSHTHTHTAHNAPLSLRHAELLVSVSETLCPSGHTSATLNPSDAGPLPLVMSSAVTQSGRRTIGRGEGDCKEGFTRGSVRERAHGGSADGWGRSKISKACAVM
jgi:hypothetical protein